MTATKFFAISAATKRNRSLGTGFDTENEAREQAVFLAETYGGVAKLNCNDPDAPELAKYSAKRGWH